MAYQTLPNTFVSGSTIYSTAVSANMVALLQGYTTGNYDGWFQVLDSEEIDINSGTAGIGSAGTSTFGNTTVSTFTATDAADLQSTLSVTSTATVGGDASVTGNVTAAAGEFTGTLTVGGTQTVAGDLSVTGDVYTSQWADVGAATAAVTGYDNAATCINSYRWMRLGNTVHCSINLGGASTATTLSFNLPVTAGSSQIDMGWLGTGQDNNATLQTPTVVYYTTGDTLRVDAYSRPDQQSWTNSNNKAVVAQFTYEVD